MKQSETGFPVRFFVFYVVYYSFQAIYNSYTNLYLNGIGFNQAQIGMAVSIATGTLLLIQPLWGLASDRARFKNTVLKILLLSAAAAVMLYPLAQQYWGLSNTSPYVKYWLLLGVTAIFSAVFSPISPLQDTITLEHLEGKRWDFGQIRLGGTLGYAFTVLLTGWLLHDNYSIIFPVISAGLLVCFGLSFLLPKVSGHRHGAQRAPIRKIFANEAMLCLIFFNLVYSLCSSLYYNFYPIYFSGLAGVTSTHIGALMFASAIAEVPFLFFASKFVGRFGIPKMLVASGLITSVRWLLLFLLQNPIAIIGTNLLHGLGFVVVNYCLAVYINTSVPKELRATGQTMMAMLAAIFSRLIFGYLGGLAADWLGAGRLMLFSAVVMVAGTVAFALWFRSINRKAGEAAI